MSGRPNFDAVTARATPPVAAQPDRACAGEDPRIFFPDHRGHTGPAREICRRCPHRQPCLDWALQTGQTHGVWGGLSAEERHAMTQETP